MGTTEEPNSVDLGDAAALTPSLFLGHYLFHLDHIRLDRPDELPEAVAYIRSGGTVLTPDAGLATAAMLCLGISVDDALEKLHRATTVLDRPTF